MKAKLNIPYSLSRDYYSEEPEGTEVLVYETIMADASDVLNSPLGMCYLCEKDGIKEYVPIKYLDITDSTPTKDIDWEQRRFELVKSLSSAACSSVFLENYTYEELATMIIEQADVIIKQLKKD